jgi:hypothetical protein
MEVINTGTGWLEYYEDGVKLLKAAVTPGKKKIFNDDIIYNLVCMSIEKLFMAFFLYNSKMPDNHTMKDLVESAARLTVIAPELKANMLFLDGFQDICPVYTFKRLIPEKKDMERVIKTLYMAKSFVDCELKITPKEAGGCHEKNNTA